MILKLVINNFNINEGGIAMAIKLNADFKKQIRATQADNNYRESHYNKKHALIKKITKSVTVLVVLGSMLTIGYRFIQYRAIKSQVAEVNVVHKKVNKSNNDLKQQVLSLKDPTYLQQLIREKYMYTKEGEQVYNLPTTDPDANK